MELNMINQINDVKSDTIILKYYPYIDDFNNILDIKANTNDKKTQKYLTRCNNIIDTTYNEVSINDKYARIYVDGNIICYKKQLYLHIPENIKGIYILELRLTCDSYCLPNIIDYHSNIKCDEKMYKFTDINICYNTNNNNTYFEINKSINMNNIENDINTFINKCNQLIQNDII